MKLTDGASGNISKSAPPKRGQRLIFDEHRDSPRGFALRLTAAGGKAFILRYTLDGRQRRMTIGSWPTWSLEAARAKAREVRQQIDRGHDPLDAAKASRQAPTVAAAVAEFLDSHATGLASEKAIRGYFERDVLPTLGREKLAKVRQADILAIVETKAAKTPVAARRLLAYLKVFFDWCVIREKVPLSPAASIKPKAVKRRGKRNGLKSVKRGRVLDDGEIRSFWAAESAMHPLTHLALKLVIVTGQRPGEVAGMSLEEIHKGVWTIPASRRGKTEVAHRVPLTDLAVEIIEQAAEGKKTGQLFAVKGREALTVNALSRAVSRSRAVLGNRENPDWGFWRPHDLRRTCRTGLARCRISDEIGERVLGHNPESMVQTYSADPAAYDEGKRLALEAWERRLRLIVAGRNPDKAVVVPIGRAG